MKLRCTNMPFTVPLLLLLFANPIIILSPPCCIAFVIQSTNNNINFNCKITRVAFRCPRTNKLLLLSSTKEELLPPPPSPLPLSVVVAVGYDNDDNKYHRNTIACAASVVSYQCAEERLGNALSYLNNTTLDNEDFTQKITRDVRGRLEDYNNDDDDDDDDDGGEDAHDNIVDTFLSTLASTTCGKTDLQSGLRMCEFLVKELPPLSNNNNTVASTTTTTHPSHDDDDNNNENDGTPPLEFMPPSRSLVGTINGMDVALLRDKEDVNSRFSMLFSVDRAKGLKIARLLAEIDNEDGCVVVHIRGMHVAEAHRKKGLATLLLAFFSQFCRVTFGKYPKTVLMNKPGICAALESLGFSPVNEKWPVFVAQHWDNEKDSTDKEEHNGHHGVTTLMMAANGIDLGPQFPHAVRKAQSIELVTERPEGSRRVHVLTKFDPPLSRGGAAEGMVLDPVERRLDGCTCQLYSARIVAFMGTVGNAKHVMFGRSKGLNDAM